MWNDSSDPTLPADRLSPGSTPHVLLASSPYSGSTLVSYLLGVHPEISTVSDVSGRRRESRMATFTCSCGRLMTECPFWLQVRDGMRQAGHPDFDLANFGLGFDHRRSRTLNRMRVGSLRWSALEVLRDAGFQLWPGDEAAMRAIGQRNRHFASTVTTIDGGRTFVDASKERLRARFLRRYVDPGVKVIHLVRDVRGVVASARGHASHATSTVEGLARDWARTNDAIVRVSRTSGPNRYLIVRYEELCHDPPAVLARMYAFCGVAPLEVPPPLTELHLLGNRVRMASLDEIRLDERWKTTLAPDEQSAILELAAPTQRRLASRPPR